MKLLKGYIHFVDACLADLTAKNDVLRVDLLAMPMTIAATFTVLPAIVLRMVGAVEWPTVFGGIFVGLMVLHFVVLYWRWSMFDYEDYTGKTRDPHYEDFS